MDKHRQAEWIKIFPGVLDAGIASCGWKDSSRGMGQH